MHQHGGTKMLFVPVCSYAQEDLSAMIGFDGMPGLC